MRVYYLCPAQFAISNIALRRIKISRFSDLNDPFELLAVDLADKSHRAAFKKWKDEENSKNGLICFSGQWSNPVIWGHYAERHTGVALGFDIPGEVLTPVAYVNTPMSIKVNKETGKPIITEKTMSHLFRLKFHDWKYENESRMFIKLDHKTVESGMYFYPFDSNLVLREVILGPRCELPISGVRAMVESFHPYVAVIKSRLAFSSFRVIKNKIASLLPDSA